NTQFVPSRRMGLCDPIHQIVMWDDFKGSDYLDSSPAMMLDFEAKPEQQQVFSKNNTSGASHRYDQEATKPDKVLRRLAQNREAARKSRLRKKAYVQQLESCKQRLVQIERELHQAKKQGFSAGHSSETTTPHHGGTTLNQCVVAFENEYRNWAEAQDRHVDDLKRALESNAGDSELDALVERGMKHYSHLFSMKASVAKADVLYVMSGLWRSSAERFFFWMGGFRPSELIKVLAVHLEPLSEQQRLDVSNLRQSCQQAEDALSHGIEKLHQIIADMIVGGRLGDGNCHLPEISAAAGKIDSLVRFAGQADHLRQETLQQVTRILSPRQAATCFLAMSDYFRRLQTLSSVWSTRQRQTT
ncbi:hypothetical protein M569_09619, partial [Genlisea aurea]